MIVFNNYENARAEMPRLSRRLERDVFLTYGPYGCNPRRIEFALKTEEELIGKNSPYIMCRKRLLEEEIEDYISMDDLRERLPDFVPFITHDLRCGALAVAGSKRFRMIESIPIKTFEY